MIIAAVDLGKARTGIAVCDKTEFLASPHTVIFEKSPEKLFEKVKETVVNLKAEIVVVGLPKNMDGSEGESAQNARAFAERLHNETGLQVDFAGRKRYYHYSPQLFKRYKYKRQKKKKCGRRSCRNDNFAKLS